MFSVKWVYDLDGLEVHRIFETERVTAAFNNDGPSGPARARPAQVAGRDVERSLVIIGDGYDLGDLSLGHGKVYVMNQAGRTVASYDLGPHPVADDAQRPDLKVAA